MTTNRIPTNDGYHPVEKGYQPSQTQPPAEPTPQGGYQPTSQQDNPANNPPGRE